MEEWSMSTLLSFLQEWWLAAIVVLLLFVLWYVGKELISSYKATIERVRKEKDDYRELTTKLIAELVDWQKDIIKYIEINQVKIESLYNVECKNKWVKL